MRLPLDTNKVNGNPGQSQQQSIDELPELSKQWSNNQTDAEEQEDHGHDQAHLDGPRCIRLGASQPQESDNGCSNTKPVRVTGQIDEIEDVNE